MSLVQFQHFYQPQRSWAKLIFLHLSVILLTGGVPGLVLGGVPGLVPGGVPGRPLQDQVPPRTGTPPGPGTPPDQVPPRTRYPPRIRYTPTPPDQVPPKYGQRVAGTHPTGMHSCCMIFLHLNIYACLPNGSTLYFTYLHNILILPKTSIKIGSNIYA